MPIPLQDGWLYGPVDSRRYGRSLGVNPLPLDRKLCSLDCLYCQYGFTRAQEVAGRAEVPSMEDLAAAFDREFERLAAADDVPDRITVAGNGEPTLHPDFYEWSRTLAEARTKHFGSGTQIGLLTNGLHLNKADVIAGMKEFYDEPAIKLECGTPECFAALYQVSAKGLQRTLDGLDELDSFVIQALFIHGPTADNAAPDEVAAWLEHLQTYSDKIRHVEIYTLDRPAADQSDAERVRVARLNEIADQVRALGLTAEVFAREEDV